MSEQTEKAIVKPDQAQTELAVIDPAMASFGNWLDVPRFEHVQRIAKVFAESQLVPQHFRGKVADCIIGIQMAMRLQVDPFMFLQNTYVVYGRPGMEAKLTIALINSRGPFDGPVQWKFSGERGKDDWTCTAYATHKRTGRVCEASVDWAMVKAEKWLDKDGSKWKTMPEMMFRYRSATFLARLYCPEVMMGLPTADELEDIGDRTIDVRPITPPLVTFDKPADLEPQAQTQPAPEPPRRRGRKPAEPEARTEPAPEPQQPEIPVAGINYDGKSKILIFCNSAPPESYASNLTAAGYVASNKDLDWTAPAGSIEACQVAEAIQGEMFVESVQVR